MRKLKKMASGLLAALFLLSLPGCAAQAEPAPSFFSDISANAWYAEAAAYMQKRGLMDGVGGGNFDPTGTLSRAMMVTVLYRIAGEPEVSGNTTFQDVRTGAWYEKAVTWAQQEKIVEGYSAATFGVNDPLTREQMAAILWRYAGSPEVSDGTAFADGDSISGWAKEAVSWARENQVINGVGNNRFDPKGTANRAQLAQVLMNGMEKEVIEVVAREESAEEDEPAGSPSTTTPESPEDGLEREREGQGEDVDLTNRDTLLYATADASATQVLKIWESGKAPASRSYTDTGFEPYITSYPVPKGTAIKGAVLICPGGAFQFRSSDLEGTQVAQALARLGYQSFVVDYRLRQEEGALDLARAVRFVRKNAAVYGIDENDIAVMGFSAGGILAGEMLLNYDGTVTGTALDSTYVPDALDEYSADAAACGMIYSGYGRLGLASVDVEVLRRGNLPPTYFCYGSNESFITQIRNNMSALESAGVETAEDVQQGWGHGFGAMGTWIPKYADWLEGIFARTAKAESVSVTEYFNANSKISDVVGDSAFGDFGRLLVPADGSYWSGTTLSDLSLTWYQHPDTKETVEIVNTMKSHAVAGEKIFYDIYTEEEKAADSKKKDTGLFFFKGNPGEKFAVCNAGGGFAYVGAMQDSFPHALELSKMGYNAFALIYRPGWTTAMEDLGRALQFIEEHADELQVAREDYSLWGGSAGARMAATLGNRVNLNRYAGSDIPQAAAVIMQYTGHSETSADDAPTYACCGTSDGIANWQTMQNHLNTLTSRYNIPTEFHAYEGLPHGFGLGIGTVAEGWINDAVRFWKAQAD